MDISLKPRSFEMEIINKGLKQVFMHLSIYVVCSALNGFNPFKPEIHLPKIKQIYNGNCHRICLRTLMPLA
jgi:hypothetical protein